MQDCTESPSSPKEDISRLDPGRVILAPVHISFPFSLKSLPSRHCFYQATRKATKLASVFAKSSNPFSVPIGSGSPATASSTSAPSHVWLLGHHAPLLLCPLATLPCLFPSFSSAREAHAQALSSAPLLPCPHSSWVISPTLMA